MKQVQRVRNRNIGTKIKTTVEGRERGTAGRGRSQCAAAAATAGTPRHTLLSRARFRSTIIIDIVPGVRGRGGQEGAGKALSAVSVVAGRGTGGRGGGRRAFAPVT